MFGVSPRPGIAARAEVYPPLPLHIILRFFQQCAANSGLLRASIV